MAERAERAHERNVTTTSCAIEIADLIAKNAC